MKSLIALIILMIILISGYSFRQNTKQVMGGSISRCKSIWLGICMFYYFVFSLWWYFQLEEGILKQILSYLIIIFFIRFIIQGSSMFYFKNWKPVFGIAFNLASILFVMISSIWLSSGLISAGIEQACFAYLIMIAMLLATDTFFVFRFRKIVGKATRGDHAIWFASNKARFKFINRISCRVNIIYLSLSLLLVLFINTQI